MNRIMKWIQERKAYSNPVFGAMLIVSATIFPVFQASARIAEPVQSMALNADQVIDALNAMEFGVTVEQAFMEQPLPYREFVRFQNELYHDLFQEESPLGGEGYLLDLELNSNITTYIYEGHTFGGILFDLEIAQMYVSSTDLSDYSPEEIDALTEVSDNSIGIIGVIRTQFSEYHFAGILLQLDNTTDRFHEILILNEVSQADFEYYQNIRDALGVTYFSDIASTPESSDPIGGPQVDDYNSCAARAQAIYNGKLRSNQIQFAKQMLTWVLLSAIAAALCAKNVAVPIIGWLFTGGCAIKVAATAGMGLAAILGDLAFNNLQAANERLTDLTLCCINYPDTCPDDPQ